MAIGAPIDEEVHHRVQIIVFAIDFVGDTRQVFRFHQLKLVADRRDDAFVSFAGVVNERAVAALHFLFDYPAPTHAMIHQFAVPLVIVEGDFTGCQILLRHFTFAPGLAAFEFVEFAFGVSVPGVEKFARVAPLWLPVRVA